MKARSILCGPMIMGDPDAPYNANGMHMKKYKKQ